MKRYKLTIEYKGTNFSGWQIQPDARTVEGELEAAFARILQLPIDVIGQGRTDAGVHAKGQVAHFDLESDFNPQKLIRGVNSATNRDIFIKSIEEVDQIFHARFDATTRSYQYTVLKYPSPIHSENGWFPGYSLDLNTLIQCSELLIGEHDFDGFSKFNEENYTTLCTVVKSNWSEHENSFMFEIEANRFLRNMVRRLVGTMVEVSKGKILISDFEKILNNQMEAPSTFTAPAKGLVLEKVFYKK